MHRGCRRRNHAATHTRLCCFISASGRTDRTNIDKIYILAKLISSKGQLETLWLGVGEQTKRGAAGLLHAIKKAVDEKQDGLWGIVCKKLSSLVTDGYTVNTESHAGLWTLMDAEVKTQFVACDKNMVCGTSKRVSLEGSQQIRQ